MPENSTTENGRKLCSNGLRATKEPEGGSPQTPLGKTPHGGKQPTGEPHPPTILDVTISCPTCPSYICNAAAATNDHCTKLAENNKHTKYDDLASKLDCRVVAAAFTTYGGWGEDFKTTLVDPYVSKIGVPTTVFSCSS